MAQMCVSGKQLLYAYCRDHGIPHRNCGKLIVATTPKETSCNRYAPMPKPTACSTYSCLQTSRPRAGAGAGRLRRRAAVASTGIIDSHAYMLALQGDAEAAGAAFAFHTRCCAPEAFAGQIEIEAGGDAPVTLQCDLLVNAAGLGAPGVARNIEGMPIGLIPCAYLAKGN